MDLLNRARSVVENAEIDLNRPLTAHHPEASLIAEALPSEIVSVPVKDNLKPSGVETCTPMQQR